MTLHTEIHFEDEICGRPAANGWLYAAADEALYDCARALFPADLIAWAQATQPQARESLARNHGASAQAVLLDRVRKQINVRGLLAADAEAA